MSLKYHDIIQFPEKKILESFYNITLNTVKQ